MWRYVRYKLRKNLQKLDLDIEKRGDSYTLNIKSKKITINFSIPLNAKKNDEIITITINSLLRQIKKKLFKKN